VTDLKKLMLEELERRNYAASTTRAYPRAVEEYARYFNRPPDQLGPDHISQYQAYLFRERKLQPNTVIQHLGGIRFFYIRTLKQSWSADLTPYPKKVIHLPSILSREEVNSLIESAPTPFQRTLLMTLYATGLRRAELARLKVTDIDSGRNVIHVQGGKGRRDRDVMLSPNLLETLREHYRSSAPETYCVAVSRQPLAHRQSSDFPQGDLAGMPASGRRCRDSERSPSSHPASLLRHSSAGRRCGPADDTDSARTPRSGRDHHLSPSLAKAPERYREPARLSSACPETRHWQRYEVDVEAARRGGRHHPRSRAELFRKQSEVA
jgi:integrase